MAPPKKKRRRKQAAPGFRLGAAHRAPGQIEVNIPAGFDSTADIEVSNEGCTCLNAILAVGFDPYVTIKLWPSKQLFSTKPVFNVKRAAKFTEREDNLMQWTIDREQLSDCVLSLGVYDEEIGVDPQVGHAFIKVDKHVQTYLDEKEIEVCIKGRRSGRKVFAGVVNLKIAIEGAQRDSQLIIKVLVLGANHLKKEREADVATDKKTMFYVVVGFFSFIVLVGTLFHVVEKPDSSEEIASSRIASWWDGFWFVFITATTVGFGDKFPWTPAGRYINSLVICFDVLFIGFALGLIVDFIADSAEKARSKMKEETFDEGQEYRNFLGGVNQLQGVESIEPTIGSDSEESVEDLSDRQLAKQEQDKIQLMFLWDLGIHTFLVALLIFLGSIFFYYEQKNTDSPWTYAQALHFCFVTMSTVGYGDIAPSRERTQAVCVFYILFGVGLLVRLGGLVVDKISESNTKKIAQMRADETLMHWEQITEFDQDGDGELDLDEFCRAMLRSTGKATEYDFEQIDARFDMIDKDKSGFITAEDFLEMQAEKEQEGAVASAGGSSRV